MLSGTSGNPSPVPVGTHPSSLPAPSSSPPWEFSLQGIKDPLGGINSLWPLFGICNQLLATVALCVATTIIVKVGCRKLDGVRTGRVRYVFITLIPLCWLVAVTFTASWHKVLDPNPRIGFLAHARQLAATGANPRLIFNDRLDAAVTGVLVVMVATILIESGMVCLRIISGSRSAETKESPFVMTRLALEEQA